MNDEGRDLLVAAALRGHKQVDRFLHINDGECALGVLHLSLHKSRTEALECYTPIDEVVSQFELNADIGSQCTLCGESSFFLYTEKNMIAHYNDDHGLDFLTIARKV